MQTDWHSLLPPLPPPDYVPPARSAATVCCTKCGEEKPATTEFFSRDAKKRNGLASLCRACNNKRSSQYQKQWPAVVRRKVRVYHQANRAMREVALARGFPLQLGDPTRLYSCPRCGEEKPRTEEFFHHELRTSDGLQYLCKPCNNAASVVREQRWRAKNPEKARERDRQKCLRRKEKHDALRPIPGAA